MKDKENAFRDAIKACENSWTWERMTPQEQVNCYGAFQFAFTICGAVNGSYDNRRKVMNAVYNAYLQGLGYDGPNWREAV